MTRLGSVQLPVDLKPLVTCEPKENIVLKSFEGLSFLTTEDLHLLTIQKASN